MADRHEYLSIPSDDNGFVSFECPFGGHQFKLKASECQAEDVLQFFCPACGLPSEPKDFLTRDVQEAIHIKQENMARDAINDIMKQMGQRFRSSKFIKVTPGKPLAKKAEKVLIEPTDLECLTLECCNREVKVEAAKQLTGFYCPYCGGRL